MKYKQLTIKRGFQKADHDLFTARKMLEVEDDEVPTDVVCFHCQQCAEKCLKAFLVYSDQDFPKTHSLKKLVNLAIPHYPCLSELNPFLNDLEDYAVEIRYIDDWVEISIENARQAFKEARTIREFIGSIIHTGES